MVFAFSEGGGAYENGAIMKTRNACRRSVSSTRIEYRMLLEKGGAHFDVLYGFCILLANYKAPKISAYVSSGQGRHTKQKRYTKTDYG